MCEQESLSGICVNGTYILVTKISDFVSDCGFIKWVYKLDLIRLDVFPPAFIAPL